MTLGRIRHLALFSLLAWFAPALAAASSPDATPGVPWTGAVGIKLTTAQITERRSLRTSESAESEMAEREKIVPDRSHLPQAPGAIESSQWPPAGKDSELQNRYSVTSTAGPQSLGISFTGATLSGVHPTFSFPPDGMGAVGPTQFVVFVNGRLVTYNKINGVADNVLNEDPDNFFLSVSNGIQTSDPRIRYDRLSGRWYLVIINVSTPNRVLIACTDAASQGIISLSTVWSFFHFDVSALPPSIAADCFGDYPTLGVDNNALYIGTNVFCGSPLSFRQCDGFVVRKNSITGGGPIVVTALRALVPTSSSAGPYTPQGVDNYSTTANEGYFIGPDNVTFSRLVLRRVSDPGGTPSVSGNINITVPTTTLPMTVPHLGNTNGTNGNLAGLDDRLFAAHLRNGRLWTAHNIKVNNTGVGSSTGSRNGSRWYELENIISPGTPSLLQSGTVYYPSASNTTDLPSYWIPSIMVSGQGHAAMGFSQAGLGIFANGAFTGRLAGDALGTMASPVSQYTVAAGSYNPPGDPGSLFTGRRWGDYSYTSLDPNDDMSMWTIQEFVDTGNSYALRVAHLRAPPPASLTSVPDVDAGHAFIVRTVLGTSVSGSGFYDPGANLPGGVPPFNHLTATITNQGVTGTPPTVNSATYLDPTHVQLDLNTTAADPNLPGEKYTVRITNPDGQVVSGAILRVTPGPVAVDLDRLPTSVALEPVWPNPTAGAAQVRFSLPRDSHIRVSIVDLAGREVASLANRSETAGVHQLRWDGRTANGPAPSGMYYVRYEADGEVKVRRFAMVR